MNNYDGASILWSGVFARDQEGKPLSRYEIKKVPVYRDEPDNRLVTMLILGPGNEFQESHWSQASLRGILKSILLKLEG